MNDKKIEIIPDSKICSRCKQEKPIYQFRKSQTGKYGYHNMCKICHSLDSKEKYIKNREIRLVQIDLWQQENPHKTLKYFEKWRRKKIKETRKLKGELKNHSELLDEKLTEKIEDGEVPNF